MLGTRSHRIAFDPMFYKLASAGHHLTILSHSPNKTPHENITEIQGKTVEEILGAVVDPFEDRLQNRVMDAFSLGPVFTMVCHHYYAKPQVQHLLNSSFDLIIIDALLNECSFGLASQFKRTPYILISSMPPATYTTPYLGIPSTPSLRPLTFSSTCFKTKMSYMERVWSFLDYANFYVTQQSKYFKLLEAGYKAYFPDSPSIPEFLSNVSLILSNTHVSIDHSLAQSDLIEVGGMHCRPPKILPKDIQQFLDGAGKDGFIFFSLGSALQGSQMPASFRKSILSTFSKLKQRVLWKFETEAMEDLPPNVKLTKWAPQQDVLGHKNIRLFITHSGLLSIQEAVYHGVPIIGIPILGDQFVNIQQAVDRGFGLELDFTTITEKSLTEAINILLSDSSFSKNAKLVSERFRTRAQDPLETAVFWVEATMRLDGVPYLHSHARQLDFIQYHSLDVIFFLLLLLTLFGFISVLVWKIVISRIQTIIGQNSKGIKAD